MPSSLLTHTSSVNLTHQSEPQYIDVRELVGLLEVVSRISCEDIMLLRKVAHENIGGRLWIASSSASHGARDVLEIVVMNLVVDLDWKRVLTCDSARASRQLTWFAAVSRRSVISYFSQILLTHGGVMWERMFPSTSSKHAELIFSSVPGRRQQACQRRFRLLMRTRHGHLQETKNTRKPARLAILK